MEFTITRSKNKKVYLQSLGCPKNLVDSEIMLGTLVKEGYELTTDKEAAEVIIVNTCGFLQASAKESVEAILSLAEEKKKGNCSKLIVTGCLPQRYEGELPKELPEVDLFVGTNDYPKIAELLNANLPDREYIHKPLYIHDEETPRILATPKYSAYVKISEGCNHTCSFCIIPKLRGKQRSRPIGSIVEEIRRLQDQGVREFNLIAQDSTDYGGDLHDGTTIERLLAEIAKLSGEHWFRLMYAYPLRATDELIEILASSENFCRYIDIPFQHINDRILKSMRRGSDGGYIRDLVERLRKKIPEIAIRTTFIAGYPEETDEEFEELLRFIEKAQFDRMGVFRFSSEEGTPAATLKGQVPDGVKEERRRAAMELQRTISLKKNRDRIGKKIKILVEEDGRWGRSEWDAPEIDGKVFLNGPKVSGGNFRKAVVTEARPYDLIAEVV